MPTLDLYFRLAEYNMKSRRLVKPWAGEADLAQFPGFHSAGTGIWYFPSWTCKRTRLKSVSKQVKQAFLDLVTGQARVHRLFTGRARLDGGFGLCHVSLCCQFAARCRLRWPYDCHALQGQARIRHIFSGRELRVLGLCSSGMFSVVPCRGHCLGTCFRDSVLSSGQARLFDLPGPGSLCLGKGVSSLRRFSQGKRLSAASSQNLEAGRSSAVFHAGMGREGGGKDSEGKNTTVV